MATILSRGMSWCFQICNAESNFTSHNFLHCPKRHSNLAVCFRNFPIAQTINDHNSMTCHVTSLSTRDLEEQTKNMAREASRWRVSARARERLLNILIFTPPARASFAFLPQRGWWNSRWEPIKSPTRACSWHEIDITLSSAWEQP